VPERKEASSAPDTREIAVAAAWAAAEKQAERVAVLDVRDLIIITDYFVIASGQTERQVRTVVQEVERALRDRGVKPVRREGETEGLWALLDFVDIVVHVFRAEERDFYDLERLWADAPIVEWETAGAASRSG
jgi:ribosome-associated protein